MAAQNYNLDYINNQKVRNSVLGNGPQAPAGDTTIYDQNMYPGGSATFNESGPAANAPTPPLPPQDQWGNQTGSQQSQIDTFWNQVTNAHRNDFTPDELNAWGVTKISGDKYRLPNGQTVDTVGDYGPGGENRMGGWTISGGQPGQNGQPMSSGSSGPAAPGASSAGGGTSDFQGQIRQLLLSQLGQMGAAPSINDPALKGQSDAYRVAQERSGQQQRSALAERDAFTGLNSGGAGSGSFDTGIQGIGEQVGQNIAGHDASLVGGEVQSRRATLQNLLGMAMQSGDAEATRAIQLQIAQMDNELRKYTYDDTMGYNVGRANEDDFRYRANLGLGVY